MQQNSLYELSGYIFHPLFIMKRVVTLCGRLPLWAISQECYFFVFYKSCIFCL